MSGRQLVERIGLKPTFIHNVGEQRRTPKDTPLEGQYRQSYCSFELAEASGFSFVDSIQKWNKHFAAKSENLSMIRQTGGTLEYFVGLFLDRNGGFTLEPKDLRQMADLGIRMAFDIYP